MHRRGLDCSNWMKDLYKVGILYYCRTIVLLCDGRKINGPDLSSSWLNFDGVGSASAHVASVAKATSKNAFILKMVT